MNTLADTRTTADPFTTLAGRAALHDIEEFARRALQGLDGPFPSFDPGKVDYFLPRTLNSAIEAIARYAATRVAEVVVPSMLEDAKAEERARLLEMLHA